MTSPWRQNYLDDVLPTIYEASLGFYKRLYGFLRETQKHCGEPQEETLPIPLTANLPAT